MTIEPDTDYEADIRNCVRVFYEKAAADDLIGPVFTGAIRDWDGHLKTMDDFWSASLLGTTRYTAAPFAPHLKLEMTQAHFDRWLELWAPSVEQTLPESLQAKALAIGQHMSHCWGRAYVSMKKMTAAG
ncbi:MAG: Hemoglobin [Hyphomicrobiales bacterium]|nr:Hemoglobin [Hyphomicrobiales bacterium]